MLDTINKKVYAYGALIVLFILVWFLFCREGVHHDSSGAAAVADRIDSAKELNNKAESERAKAEAGITNAEKSADRIETSLEQSADYNRQLSASIDRCQQILERVQQRGAKETE